MGLIVDPLLYSCRRRSSELHPVGRRWCMTLLGALLRCPIRSLGVAPEPAGTVLDQCKPEAVACLGGAGDPGGALPELLVAGGR